MMNAIASGKLKTTLAQLKVQTNRESICPLLEFLAMMDDKAVCDRIARKLDTSDRVQSNSPALRVRGF
ncbi:MAG: hypothetical protein SW833_22020 [Cyanobacteriota bacterium]|nr:hypothetical protein [Cyanobacteriota bacterium]